MEMVQNLIRNLSAAEKLQFYSYHTKPVLNFQALFTDGSSNYMNPVVSVPQERMQSMYSCV